MCSQYVVGFRRQPAFSLVARLIQFVDPPAFFPLQQVPLVRVFHRIQPNAFDMSNRHHQRRLAGNATNCQPRRMSCNAPLPLLSTAHHGNRAFHCFFLDVPALIFGHIGPFGVRMVLEDFNAPVSRRELIHPQGIGRQLAGLKPIEDRASVYRVTLGELRDCQHACNWRCLFHVFE